MSYGLFVGWLKHVKALELLREKQSLEFSTGTLGNKSLGEM